MSWIENELFTSYIYPDNIKKPVLYPIKTSSGKILSRGFPLEDIPGERVDHPHHVGHWMNYGDVNGLDFWNNSTARPEEDSHLYGSIFHKEIKNIAATDESGILEVVNEWKTPDGMVLLEEHTRFVFSVQGRIKDHRQDHHPERSGPGSLFQGQQGGDVCSAGAQGHGTAFGSTAVYSSMLMAILPKQRCWIIRGQWQLPEQRRH